MVSPKNVLQSFSTLYTKTVDSGFRVLWFATQDRDIQAYSTPSNAKLA